MFVTEVRRPRIERHETILAGLRLAGSIPAVPPTTTLTFVRVGYAPAGS